MSFQKGEYTIQIHPAVNEEGYVSFYIVITKSDTPSESHWYEMVLDTRDSEFIELLDRYIRHPEKMFEFHVVDGYMYYMFDGTVKYPGDLVTVFHDIRDWIEEYYKDYYSEERAKGLRS